MISSLLQRFRTGWTRRRDEPISQRHGRIGEEAALRRLELCGFKCLTRNYRSDRGEIDLIFRDDDCLVFVEVKARERGQWTRPAAAVNAEKRRRIAHCAMDYLAEIGRPEIKIRFDIVEVIIEQDHVSEIRHLPAAFQLPKPLRYG